MKLISVEHVTLTDDITVPSGAGGGGTVSATLSGKIVHGRLSQYKLDYSPGLRMLRVTFRPTDQRRQPVTFWVPDSNIRIIRFFEEPGDEDKAKDPGPIAKQR